LDLELIKITDVVLSQVQLAFANIAAVLPFRVVRVIFDFMR
jgi:hypothetical protein